MLSGRYASPAGSSTKHLDWGVKINFQPQLGSRRHYSAPLEWIFLPDKRTICCSLLLLALFCFEKRLILSLSYTFPANTPLESSQSCHRGADNFLSIKEDALRGAPGTQQAGGPVILISSSEHVRLH